MKRTIDASIIFTCNIKPFGENHVIIEFSGLISLDLINLIHQLQSYLYKKFPCEIGAVIPAYNSLTIEVNKNELSLKKAIETIKELIHRFEYSKNLSNTNFYELPVCYDDRYAPDLIEVSDILELSKEEIISLHTSKAYHIFMIGFLPGFLYLGETHPNLHISRHGTPKVKLQAGSVGLAGSQTGIYSMDSPGGWRIIGNCPIPTYTHDREPFFPFEVMDQIRFKAIESDEFQYIREMVMYDRLDFNSLRV